MNKKQVSEIIQRYNKFKIITSKYTSPQLTLNRIDFIGDAILKIKQDSYTDVFLQIKDIIIIKGVGKK